MPDKKGPYVSSLRPDNIVPKLLFAFFGHMDDFSERMADGAQRTELKRRLQEVLNVLYDAVHGGQFSEASYPWLDEAYLRTYFRSRGRRMAPFAGDIANEHLDYLHSGANRKRAVFSACVAVAAQLFKPPSEAGNHQHIGTLRESLGIIPNRPYDQQRAALHQIQQTLTRIVNPPQGAVSYDDRYQPVLKTEKEGFFLTFAQRTRLKECVLGEYATFRRAFINGVARHDSEAAPYIREHLRVFDSTRGLVFRWDTIMGDQRSSSHFTGVLYFTRGTAWLQGDSSDPFPRMRVMAVSVTDWQQNFESVTNVPYLIGKLISTSLSSGGKAVPEGRGVVIRRFLQDDRKRYERRVSYLSSEELKAEAFDPALLD